MAIFLFTITGAIGSFLLVGVWFGAAMLFGFPQPTPDQGAGLFWLLTCGSALVGAALTAVWS